MICEKLMYRRKYEVRSISITVKNETYRRDFGLSPVGGILVEFDREYFNGTCDVYIILKSGDTRIKKDLDFSTLGLIPFHNMSFDLMDFTKYRTFMECLELNLVKIPIKPIKRQICLP